MKGHLSPAERALVETWENWEADRERLTAKLQAAERRIAALEKRSDGAIEAAWDAYQAALREHRAANVAPTHDLCETQR